MLPDPIVWTKYKIKSISQLVDRGSIRPLAHLSEDFNVPPPTYAFNYRQLSHAFKSQFSRASLNMVESELEQTLRTGCAKKPTSQIYAHVVLAALSPLDTLRVKWYTTLGQ